MLANSTISIDNLNYPAQIVMLSLAWLCLTGTQTKPQMTKVEPEKDMIN